MSKIKLLLILCLLFFTGCQGKSELTRVGIVVAVAIDKDQETNEIIFTSQVIRPGALIKNSTTEEGPVAIVTSRGSTIFQAIRNTTQIFDRINYYAHTKVIVISEDIAKDGVLSYLDFFVRGKELRGYTQICVAKGAQAREVISIKEGIDNIAALYLLDIIKNKEFNNNAITSTLIDYYRDALKEGIEPKMSVLTLEQVQNLQIEKKNTDKTSLVKLTGMAVFKEDVLVGYLNEEETRGYNWIKGEVDNAAIVIPSFIEESKLVSVEVDNSKAKIVPNINNEKITFTIEIEADVILTEEQGKKEIIYPKDMLDYLDKIKEEVKNQIDNETKKAMEKIQKEYQSDIVGFGVALNKKYPKKWKEISPYWDDMFSAIEYKTEITVNMVGTDMKEGIIKDK